MGGHVLVYNDGFIFGDGGLSLVPTKHELSMMAIFGGLQASAFPRFIDPSTNERLVLSFVKGVPHDPAVNILWQTCQREILL